MKLIKKRRDKAQVSNTQAERGVMTIKNNFISAFSLENHLVLSGKIEHMHAL
jgi:hypothetical protein